MKVIKINGVRCAVQSYLKGDFVNLSPIQDNQNFSDTIGLIKIQFSPLKFWTSGKETKAFMDFVKSINIDELLQELNK